jgi:Ca2+-binding EF-hand superfamily protein
MYDFDSKGAISTEDLLDLLTLMIGGNVTKDQVRIPPG